MIILEMKADESGIRMEEIGMIKPLTENSPIVALYIDKEQSYGFLMHRNGAFQYFEYLGNENNWM